MDISTIEFPKLWGLKFDIDRVAFSIGSIDVYWYGIIISTAFLLAVLLAMKDSRKFDIDSERIIDIVLISAPAAIICARLYYVIFNIDVYIDTPVEILKIWHGGLAIYGGLIGALLTAYIYARVKKMPVLNLFDFAMPYFALAQAIGRWGNMINQEAFGRNTSLPWGMTGNQIKAELTVKADELNLDPNLPVHPTFLYESLWNLGIFIFLMWYRKRRKNNGEVFFLYMILYGAGRVWIEGLRTDSLMIWGTGLRVSQLLSAALILVFAYMFFKKRTDTKRMAGNDVELGNSEYGAVLKNFREDIIDDVTNDDNEQRIGEDFQAGEDNKDTVEGDEDSILQDEKAEERQARE